MISPLRTALLASLAGLTTAHFSITHPTPLGKSSSESEPCGGATLSLAETSEFYVGGEAVALKTGHPEVHILIRGTLDPTGEGNWTNLHPVVKQEGLGSFCEPAIKAPEDWVGKKGFVQVVQSGEDGLLYACAAVTFHAERAASVTTLCSNGTGVTGEFSSDDRLPSDGLAFGTAQNQESDDHDQADDHDHSDDDGHDHSHDDDASTTTSAAAAEQTSAEAAAQTTAAENSAARYASGLGALGAAVMGAVLMI